MTRRPTAVPRPLVPWIAFAAALALAGCVGAGKAPPKPAHDARFGEVKPTKLVMIDPEGARLEMPNYVNPPSAQIALPAYEWHPERQPTGKVRVEIILSEQRLFVFRDDTCIGWTAISTGREGYNTPAGKFKVLQKEKDYQSSLYGVFIDEATGDVVNNDATSAQKPPPGTRYEAASMPYFQRLSWDGVGLHEGYLPMYAASHGCIRVHKDMAHRLFEVTSLGTPVTIRATR